MTGSILGGASVTQAAKYQQVILFLISASNLLAVFSAVYMTAFLVCIDSRHRIRPEKILKSGKLLPLPTWTADNLVFWRRKGRARYEILSTAGL